MTRKKLRVLATGSFKQKEENRHYPIYLQITIALLIIVKIMLKILFQHAFGAFCSSSGHVQYCTHCAWLIVITNCLQLYATFMVICNFTVMGNV